MKTILIKKRESENKGSEGACEISVTREREPIAQALSFKDVEHSMRQFRPKCPPLKEFEETAEICGTEWAEPRKIIYAKKLLRGSAKVFVFYKKRMTTWARLKKSLISEFGKTSNSKKVHQELACAKKRDNESYQEYTYRMLEIASHADIETESKIQYIIDGIPDDVFHKSVLYGVSSIRELRRKLAHYENMRAQRQKSKQPLRLEKKMGTKPVNPKTEGQEGKTQERRCYNCGNKSHLTTDCLHKEKEVKCFLCGQFGYVVAKCSKKSESSACK